MRLTFTSSKKEKIFWTTLFALWVVFSIFSIYSLSQSEADSDVIPYLVFVCFLMDNLFVYGLIRLYTIKFEVTDTSLIFSTKFTKEEYELSNIRELRHICHEYTETLPEAQRFPKEWYHEEKHEQHYWFAIMKDGSAVRLKLMRLDYDSPQIELIRETFKKAHNGIKIKHYDRDPIPEILKKGSWS